MHGIVASRQVSTGPVIASRERLYDHYGKDDRGDNGRDLDPPWKGWFLRGRGRFVAHDRSPSFPTLGGGEFTRHSVLVNP